MTLTRYLYKEVKLKTTSNLRYQPFKIQLSKAAQGRKITGTVCLFFEEKSGALTFEFGAPHCLLEKKARCKVLPKKFINLVLLTFIMPFGN